MTHASNVAGYTTAEVLDCINDDGGLIMAAQAMTAVAWPRYREIHTALTAEGAAFDPYHLRDILKAFGIIAQVIEEDLSNCDPLIDTRAACWEAIGCSNFDHDYMTRVLGWFLGAGLGEAIAVADNPGDTMALYHAGEELRESFLQDIEEFVKGDCEEECY